MALLDFVTDFFQPYYDELTTTLNQLKLDRDELKKNVLTLQHLVTRNSADFTALTFEKVFEAKITALGTTTTPSDIFDTSQGSKDANGNVSYPHSFYLISAFSPDLTGGPAGGPREVVYQGTPIAINDLSLYITRTAATSPARFESRVNIYNLNATDATVYVKILKLLGTR